MDTLPLPKEDTTLLNETASMEDELGNMMLKLVKLPHNQGHQIMEEAGASSGVQLHKVSIEMERLLGTV